MVSRRKTDKGKEADHTCPVCGKRYTIFDHDMWSYKKTVKKRRMYFCSYRCFNAKETEQE